MQDATPDTEQASDLNQKKDTATVTVYMAAPDAQLKEREEYQATQERAADAVQKAGAEQKAQVGQLAPRRQAVPQEIKDEILEPVNQRIDKIVERLKRHGIHVEEL